MTCPFCKRVPAERRRGLLEVRVRRFAELVESVPLEKMRPIVDALMAIDPRIMEALSSAVLEASDLHELVSSVKRVEKPN